jgi:CxxC motif-containing protein
VTTSVLVTGGEWPLVSVKTTCPIPIDKIFSIITETKKMVTKAPVANGQVLRKKILGTKADIIATKTVRKKNEKEKG